MKTISGVKPLIPYRFKLLLAVGLSSFFSEFF